MVVCGHECGRSRIYIPTLLALPSYDSDARIQGGLYPNLAPGAVVYAQFWCRDPLGPAGYGTGLSNNLRLGIAP